MTRPLLVVLALAFALAGCDPKQPKPKADAVDSSGPTITPAGAAGSTPRP